jgi:cytoskeletal protein RodZ
VALTLRFAYDDCRHVRPRAVGPELGRTLGTFGETLRKEREKRGITLEAVSDGTKIGTRFLRALEAEQFDQLPGGVFNKGFVRAYAKHVGLDEEKAIDDYLSAAGLNVATTPEASPPSNPNSPTNKESKAAPRSAPEAIRITETPSAGFENVNDFVRRMPWTELATVLLLLVAIAAGWRYLRHRNHPESAKAANQSQPAASAQSPTSNPKNAAAAAPTGALQLVIHAQEDSWLSIATDGSAQGEVMLLAGEAKTVQADREILVKAGNAGGLAFVWNGAKVSSQGDEGEVVTLAFDRSGVRKIPPQPAAADTQH